MEAKELEMPERSEAPVSPPRPNGHAARNAARHASAGDLAAVGDAVRAFFASEFQAREIRITRIAALAGTDAGWEAEAEILVPDLAIMTLGLKLTQKVFERRSYAVQVGQSLAVKGFEPLDHDG